MNPETIIQNRIRTSPVLNKLGVRLFRNSVGMAYTREGTPIRYGLGTSTSDLIGWDHHGRFLAIEVKIPGNHATDDQQKFLDAVNAHGGLAFVAHSEQEAILKIKENL